MLLKALFNLGLVSNYYFSKNFKKEKLLNIFPTYHRLTPLTKHFKIISTPSHTLFISYKALRLLNKRVGTAYYLLSTPLGIISHKEAIKKKIGGALIGFVFV